METVQTAVNNTISISTVEINMMVGLDMGWLCNEKNESLFLNARRKSAWLSEIRSKLQNSLHDYASCEYVDSAYARSDEYGRPTFTVEMQDELLPLRITPNKIDKHISSIFTWNIKEFRISTAGVITIHIEAIATEPQKESLVRIINAYHNFRRDLIPVASKEMVRFIEKWNHSFTDYILRLDNSKLISDHFDFYDIVNIDFKVNNQKPMPKQIYQKGPFDVVKAISGLARMSAVFENYDAERCIDDLLKADLGNRTDEMWIINSSRLLHYHPEHKTQAKNLFYDDIITGLDIQLAQRCTLNYLAYWIKYQREGVLEELTRDVEMKKSTTMRQLLNNLAWASDLCKELPGISRLTKNSFFGTVMEQHEHLMSIRSMQEDISVSIDQALQTAQAIFSEHVTDHESQIEKVSMNISKVSLYISVAALVVSIVSAICGIIPLILPLLKSVPVP